MATVKQAIVNASTGQTTYVDVEDDRLPPLTLDEIDTAALNKALVAPGSVVRGIALVLLDELNLHAATITAILNAADNATTLAQFKTSMAAIVDQSQRDVIQLRAFIKAKMR